MSIRLKALTFALWLIIVLFAPGLAFLLILLLVFGYAGFVILILFINIFDELKQDRYKDEKPQSRMDYLKLVKDALVELIVILPIITAFFISAPVYRLKENLAERDIENKTLVFNIWESTRYRKKDHPSEMRDFALQLSEMSGEIEIPKIESYYGSGLLPRDLIEYKISFDKGEYYALRLSSGDRKGILKLVEIFNAEAEKRTLEKRFYIVKKKLGRNRTESKRARIGYFKDKQLKKFLGRHSRLELSSTSGRGLKISS